KLISPTRMMEKTIIFRTFLLLFELAILFHLRHFYDGFVSKLNQSIEDTALVGRASHEPFIRKRQRTAALQDASEGEVLPGFREVLDCASPLALWLPLQEMGSWNRCALAARVHGRNARSLDRGGFP